MATRLGIGGWVGLLALGASWGCSSSMYDDCVDFCEQVQSCPSPAFGEAGCEAHCDFVENLADASDCEDQTSGYVACAAEAADVCDPVPSCTGEMAAYYHCIVPYCTANESAPECRGAICTEGHGGSGDTCTATLECTGLPAYELACVSGTCTCRTDGVDQATVPFQDGFCGEDHDAAIDAAKQACGWDT